MSDFEVVTPEEKKELEELRELALYFRIAHEGYPGQEVELSDGTVVKGGYQWGMYYIVYKGTVPITMRALDVVKLTNNKTESINNEPLPQLQRDSE